MVYGVAHGPTLHWLRGGGVKGGEEAIEGIMGGRGRGNIWGGFEWRRNIREREGWVGERYEGGLEGGQI